MNDKNLSFSEKIGLMKLDRMMNDIHRLYSDVPSDYVQTKTELEKARAILYSDTKKASKQIGYALRSMQKESVVASRYNRIAENIRVCGDKVIMESDKEYHEALARGNYKKANTILSRISTSAVIVNSKHVLQIKMDSHSDSTATFIIFNTDSCAIMVPFMEIRSSGAILNADPPSPFSVQPNAHILIRCECPEHSATLSISLEYEYKSTIRNIDTVFSLV
ncbi:MAG: hypothetical protein WCR83_06035 [Candidatus Methanomethylophilaceae archaeon]